MNLLVNFAILTIFILQLDVALTEDIDREKKLLPVFQVVRFPNDACNVSGGAKNGTCYTAEECSNKNGVNGGSCASGFGVCCIFSAGCGSSSSQNCTYFEVTGAVAGPCSHKVCKCASDICQIRLDFDTFAITGPSTNTLSISKILAGEVQGAAGKQINSVGQCLTDRFGISGDTIVPSLCGTLSGQHVYYDASDDCNSLDFAFGQSAVGLAAAETNRRFSIKITQVPCTSPRLAPPGCLQYHTGSATAKGSIKTFNYDQGQHLASQKQTICFRREAGNCRVCFSAEIDTDVQLGGKNTKAKYEGAQAASCCAYGVDGMKSTHAYDCVIIPGAEKMAASPVAMLVGSKQCGGMKGLVTTNAGTGVGKTVCSRIEPFQIAFMSDAWELAVSATIEPATKGFKLTYFQSAC